MTQTQTAPLQAQIFELPSGAKLAVTVAPFVDAWSLMKATLKALKGMQLDSNALSADIAGFLTSPAGVSILIDRVAEFATSPEVEAALWQCATRALYIPAGSAHDFPGEPVNRKLLDSGPDCGITVRGDYSRIITALMEVNCKPFLAQVLSGLLKQKAKSPSVQPSK